MATTLAVGANSTTDITGYSIKEDATPTSGVDNSGGVGTISVGIAEEYNTSELMFKGVKFADGYNGETSGIVRSLGGDELEATIDGDSRMISMVTEVYAEPYIGTLGGAIRYYLGLADISADIMVDPITEELQVNFIHWRGLLWDYMKKLCAAFQIEVSLVSDNIVVRQVRGRIAENAGDASIEWALDASNMVNRYVINNYNLQPLTDVIVYPEIVIPADNTPPPPADIIDWYGTAGQRVTVPTHVSPAGGQSTHPSVLYFELGWNGYKYWMAHTPYPLSNDAHEDPNIAVSNDGQNWIAAPGVVQPLDDAPGGTKYNSDVELTMGPGGEMYLFWRYLDTTLPSNQEKIYYRKSSNGKAWATKELAYQSSIVDRRLLSPSIAWESGTWTMWAVDIVPSPNRVVRLTTTATTPTGWSAPTLCTVSSQAGKEPWHLEVRKVSGQWIMLVSDTTLNTSGTNGDLLSYKSANGLAWTGSLQPIVPRIQSGQHDNVYRASFVSGVRDGYAGLDVWYAGYVSSTSVWNMFRTWVTTDGGNIPTPAMASGHYANDKMGSVISLDASEVVELELETSVSLTSIKQPQISQSFPKYYTGSESIYAVIDANNVTIGAEEWRRIGGYLTAEISPEDASIILLKARGGTTPERAPYRIALIDGGEEVTAAFAALRIVGSGVAFSKEPIEIPTGVPVEIAADIDGPTVDNEFIGSVGAAFDLAIASSASLAMPKHTISVRTTHINRSGETGSLAYATYEDFAVDQAGNTYSDFAIEWAGRTYTDFRDFYFDITANTFENQAFGNIAGARVRYRDAYHRIRSGTVTQDSIGYDAESDTLYVDFQEAWGNTSYADFEVEMAGKTYGDFGVRPLWRK